MTAWNSVKFCEFLWIVPEIWSVLLENHKNEFHGISRNFTPRLSYSQYFTQFHANFTQTIFEKKTVQQHLWICFDGFWTLYLPQNHFLKWFSPTITQNRNDVDCGNPWYYVRGRNRTMRTPLAMQQHQYWVTFCLLMLLQLLNTKQGPNQLENGPKSSWSLQLQHLCGTSDLTQHPFPIAHRRA